MFDISESMRFDFERARDFRDEKAYEYPDDKRNAAAVVLHDNLAATVSDCSWETMEAVNAIFLDEDRSFCATEIWQEHLRQVGFQSDPKSAEDFCREFLCEMQSRGTAA